MITPDEIARMNDDYDNWFKKYGDSEQAVGWNKPKSAIRFKIILDKIRELVNEETLILDLGCGLAHFLHFLNINGVYCKYIGVDLNDNFIYHNRIKYPEHVFIKSNVLDLNVEADIIVASGLFNRRFDNSQNYIIETFNFAQMNAKKAFCFNYLHSMALRKYETNYYVNVGFLENHINRAYMAGFSIDASSLPGEFTFFGFRKVC